MPDTRYTIDYASRAPDAPFARFRLLLLLLNGCSVVSFLFLWISRRNVELEGPAIALVLMLSHLAAVVHAVIFTVSRNRRQLYGEMISHVAVLAIMWGLIVL